MAEIGEPGESFNFSAASRAANFRPDLDRIKQYDPYRKKYVRLNRIAQGIGLLMAGFAIRLWTTDHGIWAGVVGLLAVLILLGGYLIGRGAAGAVYASGLLIPARITSLQPLQVVALANMGNDEDADAEEVTDEPVETTDLYGLRRITLTELPLHSLRIGERVPCAAAFGGSNRGGWGHFEPRPLAWATADPLVIMASIASIPENEWQRLEQLARQLPEIDEDQVAFYRADLTFVEAK